jgi:hypothetical protein
LRGERETDVDDDGGELCAVECVMEGAVLASWLKRSDSSGVGVLGVSPTTIIVVVLAVGGVAD